MGIFANIEGYPNHSNLKVEFVCFYYTLKSISIKKSEEVKRERGKMKGSGNLEANIELLIWKARIIVLICYGNIEMA